MKHNPIITQRPVQEWLHTVHRLQPYRTPRALWLAVISSVVLSAIMALCAIEPQTNLLQEGFNTVYISVANLVIFILLYVYNFWIIRCRFKLGTTISLCFSGSMAIAALFTWLSLKIELLLYGNTTNSGLLTLIINSTAALVAFLLSILLNNVTRYQQTILENEHLQAENMLIRYETLEQQVSPHFLFNSLNTLDGLIGTDDNRAHVYLHNLSDIFRYNMQKQKEVSLSEELEFTHSYIYLMQIRHGDALSVKEDIDPSLLSRRVPPISLQLLIENAIKHNVVTLRRPLEITISTTSHGTLTVSNPLHPKADNEISTGIGLDNLSQRYKLLFNKNIDIQKSENTFCVEIPLIEEI